MSRGFTLIESLVALAVLSVGLLGAAGLLLGGMRDQSLALRQGGATLLVAGMAGRIRANPRAGAAYDSRGERDAPGDCDQSAPCTPAQLAAHDLTWFEDAARQLLPGFQPGIHVSFEPAIGSAAADRYLVSLSWRDARDPDATDEATLILLAQPVAGAP